MKKEKLEQLLKIEDEQLHKLNNIVVKAIDEEKLLSQKLAPIIMVSQNRKEVKDRQRAINDYLVNLKAEVEIRNVHQKLDLLITEQMKTLFEIQKEQINMMEEIKEVIRDISPVS